MTTILELREKIKIFMGKYDIYIIPLMKFLLAIIAFAMINGNVGFMERAKDPSIVLILALMCSFLPVNLAAVFGGILILAHAYALYLDAVLPDSASIWLSFDSDPHSLCFKGALCGASGYGACGNTGGSDSGSLRHDCFLSASLYEAEYYDAQRHGDRVNEAEDHISD